MMELLKFPLHKQMRRVEIPKDGVCHYFLFIHDKIKENTK